MGVDTAAWRQGRLGVGVVGDRGEGRTRAGKVGGEGRRTRGKGTWRGGETEGGLAPFQIPGGIPATQGAHACLMRTYVLI